MPKPAKIRSRAGTYDTFDRRYKPVIQKDGTILIDHKDLPEGLDLHDVWTVVDCDGKLYIVPGFATVNYFSRVVCTVPWPDEEMHQPGYVY